MNSSTEKIVSVAMEADPSIGPDQRTAALAILGGRVPDKLPAFLLQRLQAASAVAAGSPEREEPAKRYLRRHEAAEYLGCSVRQVDALKHDGVLPFVRLGRRLIVFRVEDIDRLMKDRRISADEEEDV